MAGTGIATVRPPSGSLSFVVGPQVTLRATQRLSVVGTVSPSGLPLWNGITASWAQEMCRNSILSQWRRGAPRLYHVNLGILIHPSTSDIGISMSDLGISITDIENLTSDIEKEPPRLPITGFAGAAPLFVYRDMKRYSAVTFSPMTSSSSSISVLPPAPLKRSPSLLEEQTMASL